MSRTPIAILLLALSLGACSDDGASDSNTSGSASDDLSLASPGPHAPGEARRRAGTFTLVRKSDGMELAVRTDPDLDIASIEVVADGTTIRRDAAEARPSATFTLPLGIRGEVVVRVTYADGETWRRTIPL